jgi:hypothetical protein
VSAVGDSTGGGDLQARLGRLERAIDRRREQVERVSAQVEVLSDEVRSPLERTVGHADDPELALGAPSYSLAARMHRRCHTTGVYTREGMREPILDLAPKLPGRAWAAANGVGVPELLGTWPDPGAVDWDTLPERFVLKGNVGAGGVNVYPLARDADGDGYTDLLTGEPTTRADVTERLWANHHEESSYFAEELLVAPGSGPQGAVPQDVKVFCFYGVPVYVEARRGDQSRAAAVRSRARTYLADGTELTNARALIDPDDGTVHPPTDLEAVVSDAARLSRTIRRPLQRLDFFETDRGVVFGEVTMSPGHVPALAGGWDERLGEAYEDAYARLLADLAAEGALGVDVPDGADGDAGGAAGPR